MFVQMIQGQVGEPDRLRAALTQWETELAPGADGWLGTTAGVTDDGRSIAVVRFESEEHAKRNSDRPEQGAWWAQTSSLFTGDVAFHDTTDVVLDLTGDPDQAGFVQVMFGQGRDPDRARQLMAERPEEWADFRPDVLGSVGALFPDGGWLMTIYFTNEEEARKNESKEPPPELKAQMDELNSLGVGVPEFFDLRQPWLSAP